MYNKVMTILSILLFLLLFDKDEYSTAKKYLLKKLNSIGKFFHRLWYFRKYRQFAGFEKRLGKAVTDQEVDRFILKSEILKYMGKYLHVNARSKYIPKDRKNKEECRQQVLGVFGDRMKSLGITINDKLELCTP